MKKALIFSLAVIFGFALVMGCAPEEKAKTEEKAAAEPAPAKTTFVTIGTGGITGVYYPTGGAIAKIVNQKKDQYGIRATVESTGGSVFNVNAVMSGDLEFGVVQSDRQYQAVNAMAEWEDKGKQEDLRAVFSIHPESITLVAAVDAGIETIDDLK
ncbi:MAG: TAXI family TRAP transporter solute-binding subunit, partial [Desulfobacterales bacterium]